MTEQLGYDKTSIASIFKYSQKLIGHSLRELVSEEEKEASNLQGQGKGGLGQMIEELFFHYPINSDPAPDFREAGMDLKATGLKELMSGELQIKERLVCDIIDYEAVVNESFENSLFFIKCHIMLLIFYLYKKGVSKWDLRYIFTVVWRLPEKDLLIIKHDFEVIVGKIKEGKAHLLSEGDTEYLAACRKGNKETNAPSSTNALRIFQETLPLYTKSIPTNPLNHRTCFCRNRTLSNELFAKYRLTNGHIGARCRHRGVNLRASAVS